MLSIFHHTEPGGHTQNEDAFQIALFPGQPDCHVCAIADGQGGRAGGAAAASLACQAACDAALACPPAALQSPWTWLKMLRAVDRAVADDPEAGFTTLVAFCVGNGWICGASNGDSAAVLFQAGKDAEDLTTHQRKGPPVGNGDAIFTPFAADLSPPWGILAMTDGVWKYAGWDKVLRFSVDDSGVQIRDRLRDAAKLPRTGALQDDFTVVVLQGRGLKVSN